MSAINQNPYSNFLQLKRPQVMPVEQSREEYSSRPETPPIASVSLGENEQKKSGGLTKVVAGVAIIASVVGLFFARGCSSKIYKNMNAYVQMLNDRIADYTKRYNSLNPLERLSLELNKKMQKVLEVVNIGNNLTAVKDAGFTHICEKLRLQGVCDWITNQFKKITILASHKAYQRARNALDINIPMLRQLSVNIKNAKERARFEEVLSAMEVDILRVTSGQKRMERLEQTEKATKNVGKKVKTELARIWQAIIRKDSDKKAKVAKLRVYRTEVHSAEGKEKLNAVLRAERRKFTFNIVDKTEIMTSAKDDIARVIKMEDTEARELLRTMSRQLQQYKKCEGPNEATNRQKIASALGETVTALRKIMLNGDKYSDESKILLKGKLAEIDSVLSETEKRGNIEELLGILSRNLKNDEPALYNKATRLAKEMRNAVNNAFDSEMKLYEKFAEYSVGSAPTDVLGMLLPLGVAGYAISKGEDKDERISATLNAGIPIVGGVATTIMAAAKMMTNAQGLVLGLVSGAILNALGSKADQSYKEWNENKAYIAKAIEAYKSSNMS